MVCQDASFLMFNLPVRYDFLSVSLVFFKPFILDFRELKKMVLSPDGRGSLGEEEGGVE